MTQLHVNSANSPLLVPPASWMWHGKVDCRWRGWVPSPIYRPVGADMHAVVVSVLYSIHIAHVDVDSGSRKLFRGGKLALQRPKKRRKLKISTNVKEETKEEHRTVPRPFFY